MNITFSKYDSIYKIVNTLKKIPNYKDVTVNIDPEHAIYQHDRRWQYLYTVIKDHHINVTFVAHTHDIKRYLEQASLPYVQTSRRNHRTTYLDISTRAESIRSFHENILIKKSNLWFLVLIAEFLVLVSLVYLFWTLISPNTTIYLTAASELDTIIYNFRYYQKEDEAVHKFQSYLSLPYMIWSVPYTYDMSTHVQNITTIQEPASWTVTLFNTLPYDFSLLDNTRLISAEWVEYTLDSRITIPRWTANQPWTIQIFVTARERYESWEIIGEDGNIPKWKRLLIKNLPESSQEELLRAEVHDWFKDGKTVSRWSVVQEDIQSIENAILQRMEEEKSVFLKKNHSNPDEIILPFRELYQFDKNTLVTTSQIGEEASFVEWRVESALFYPYIVWDDLEEAVQDYLTQRAEDALHTTTIHRDWVLFYDYIPKEATDAIPFHYIIPTSVPIIRQYDLTRDWLEILDEIKDKIVWANKQRAQEIILSYQEIENAEIRVSPRRFSSLPETKSRITFEIK